MYVTKAQIKKYLGVNFSADFDSFVDDVIASCQKWVERYCGDEKFGDRLFEAPDPNTSSTRRFDGSGNSRLYVGDLFDQETIEVDDVLMTVDSDLFLYPLNAGENGTGEAFQYLEMSQPATRLNSNSRSIGEEPYTFEAAQANVKIDGYWYFTETPPVDITLAMMKLVGAVLKENISDGDVREKKSETLGDYQVSYQDIEKTAHALKVTDLIQPYKRKISFGNAGIMKIS